MQMFQHPLGRLDFQKYKNVANKCKGKELKLMIFLEKSIRFFANFDSFYYLCSRISIKYDSYF